MLTWLTHNKHITNVTSTTQYHSSRGNMRWWTQNTWSGFLAAASAVESGDFSIWEPEWTQSWLTGLWWCIWRSAALCCVCRAGSWSVPPCPLKSGPGQRWGASSWPPQTTSPTCGRTASPTQPEYPTARGSLPCWHWTVSKVDLWFEQRLPLKPAFHVVLDRGHPHVSRPHYHRYHPVVLWIHPGPGGNEVHKNRRDGDCERKSNLRRRDELPYWRY